MSLGQIGQGGPEEVPFVPLISPPAPPSASISTGSVQLNPHYVARVLIQTQIHKLLVLIKLDCSAK